MSKNMSFRARVLWIAFSINALCTIVYTVDNCMAERKTYIDGVDKKLRSAAFALPYILPEGFHDRIAGPTSISKDEDWEVFVRNSRYAMDAGVKYVYTYMYARDTFYECASSADPENLEDGTKEPFYSAYEKAPQELHDAWDDGEIRFAEYTDEFGHFRSIFVPLKTDSGTRYIAGADVELRAVDDALTRLLLRSLLLGGGIFVVVAAVSLLVLGATLRPVTQLTGQTRALVQADFAITDEIRRSLSTLSTRGRDEFGELAGAFVDMAERLREHIEQLKKATAAKERIESELRIAHDIQMSFLQKVFPPFPDRPEFTLAASLEPAKEVGGDLYDFFFLDDDRLMFYVGDVSDKGVPASLFMAVTITLMKRVAQDLQGSPGEILAQVNDALAEENENLMFVTLFCAILNVKTGEMDVANAGHNPPLFLRSDGSGEWLVVKPGPALGVMPGAVYEQDTATLSAGETLVCYTDGVTEAMDPERNQFTPDGLKSLGDELRPLSENDRVARVIQRVHEHADTAPQSDDITVLTLTLCDGECRQV